MSVCKFVPEFLVVAEVYAVPTGCSACPRVIETCNVFAISVVVISNKSVTGMGAYFVVHWGNIFRCSVSIEHYVEHVCNRRVNNRNLLFCNSVSYRVVRRFQLRTYIVPESCHILSG